ncbi:MAG: polyprenyl synthetase family protein [Sedimentisphaerales bacterium]|nr:polyprenyl synthetase family protein [Sedimentisphaerales bacterium]
MAKELHSALADRPVLQLPWTRPICRQLAQVQELIHDELYGQAIPDCIRPVLDHVLASKGKMIRPALVLLSGLACNKITDRHICVAAIMEMLHQATLLHDDVLDQARTRRGRPATNRLWGDKVAILVGDYILSHVMASSAGLGSKVSTIIAEMARRVCTGELHQVLRRGHWQIDQQEYLQIIRDKSASFFVACCRLGAELAGARAVYVNALEGYGLSLGMVFQINDDLQDLLVGPEDGHDISTGTVTLPIISLLERTDNPSRRTWLRRLDSGRYRRDLLNKALKRHGALAYTNQIIQAYLQEALAYLTRIQQTVAKHSLVQLAYYSARPIA